MSQSRTYYSSRTARTRRPFGGASSRPQRAQRSSRKTKKDYIHPSRFVQQAKPVAEKPYEPTHQFHDFNIHELIQNNLTGMGFQVPSPIQDQAIPHGLSGSDIVGIADTGTGKTAAFAIPVLHRLVTEPQAKAIILAPTRELAQQIDEQCRLIGKGSEIDGALLIGGVAMGPQLRELRYNPRIIIGTPGRIKDHVERGSLNISDCTIVVLDEVDRMLDMGFVNDIRHIIGLTSAERQGYYFSATLDARVKGVIESFSHSPVHISVKSGDTSLNVEQDIVPYESAQDKLNKLHDVLIRPGTTKALIFDDTQRSVEKLSKELESRGFAAGSIHGGKSQSQRQRVFNSFKNSDISVLVATDVAARGLDVSDVTHVINYSTPQTYEDYVHRIGRTGRAGKVGQALTFLEV